MKHFNSITVALTLILSLIFASFAIGQNTTKNNSKNEKSSSVKVQVQKPTIDPSQMQHGYWFVDKDGNGYNDNAPDHDADGIPNGVDPDFAKGSRMGRGFVDSNGDGINDLQTGRSGKGRRGRGGYSSGRGIERRCRCILLNNNATNPKTNSNSSTAK